MERIRRFFRRLGKTLNAKGYTLVEVAAVVAVSATLAAVVVPIAVDKTKEGKAVAARLDVQQIGNGITGFYKDVGEFPAFSGVSLSADGSNYSTVKTHFVILKSGSDNVGNNPVGLATKLADTPSDFLENHVVVDNPSAVSGASYLQTYKLNWKGPYAESLAKKLDPWGNRYVVYVKAMHTPTTGAAKEYGWVISAGANGILETSKTDNVIKGDDIGIALFSAETGR